MNTYICPVCGYDDLAEQPYDKNYFNPSYEICSCCSFEYGYSEDHKVDLGYLVVPNEMKEAAFQLYRKQWIEKGAIIGSPEDYPKTFQAKGRVKQEIIIEQFEKLNLPIDNLEFLMDYQAENKEIDEIAENIWVIDGDIKAVSYKQVQQIAKDTMAYIASQITLGMNLHDIRKICEEKMLELGADSFWYWDIGAFVFAGEETTVSISGAEYITSNKIIESNDILTIDLSPQKQNIWGDYARTIIIENGQVVCGIENIKNVEWKNGLLMEEILHTELLCYATPTVTFEELYDHMNELIRKHGYINLDFSGNVGHSIVKQKNDRVYIEKGNNRLLGDVEFFTFEPHIRKKDSKYGYKKENIYYFSEDKLVAL